MGKHTTLYIRDDGSFMTVSGGVTTEIHLSGDQLLQTGIDCLRIAVKLNPYCMEAAAEALANTNVLPQKDAPCEAH